MDDWELYEMLRGFMTEQEIIKSGVHFRYNEYNDAKRQANSIRKQLGGEDAMVVLPHPCKLRAFLAIQPDGVIYVEHRSNAKALFCFSDIERKHIRANKLVGWDDVLNADIVRVFPGACGVHIEVDNVDPERLSDFGECAYRDTLAEEQERREALGHSMS